PRIGILLDGRSFTINSINSGTPASEALPEMSSFGIIISDNTVMVAISWSVKNFSSNSFCVRSCSQSCTPGSLFEVSLASLASFALSPLQAVAKTPAPAAINPSALSDSLLFISFLISRLTFSSLPIYIPQSAWTWLRWSKSGFYPLAAQKDLHLPHISSCNHVLAPICSIPIAWDRYPSELFPLRG